MTPSWQNIKLRNNLVRERIVLKHLKVHAIMFYAGLRLDICNPFRRCYMGSIFSDATQHFSAWIVLDSPFPAKPIDLLFFGNLRPHVEL